jgi:hypothetical protein
MTSRQLFTQGLHDEEVLKVVAEQEISGVG